MATPDIWTMNGVAWTEEDEQDSAELIQEIIDRDYPAIRVIGDDGKIIKTVIRAADGKRWLAVNDHETFDITRAVQYNARIIAWQRGHATPIGY
jgi:hypothetical protein